MNNLNLFWQLTRLSFQRQITYRAATLAGLVTNFFFGLLRAAVLVALYGARQEVSGISVASAVTYTGLSQATIAYLSLFGWYDIIQSVYSGEIGSDLLKPMNYFSFWMAQDLGRASANLLLRGLPIMLFYALVFHISLPSGPVQWLALAATLLLAWWVSFAFRFLVNLAAFWIPEAGGIGRFAYTLSWLFSGFIMPLRFFPDWFVRLAYLTPFPQMINTVVETYLGLLDGPQMLSALALQVAWVIILVLAGQALLRLGVKRLVIQGG